MTTPTLLDRVQPPLKALASHPVVFSAGIAALGTVWFNGTLWRYLADHLDFTTSFAFAAALVVWLLPTTLSVLLFTTLALVSNRLVKGVAIAIFLCNGIALYFIDQYQVFLDRTMMANVLHTDAGEVGALLHPKLLGYVLFWAGIPTLLVWWWPLRRVRLRERIAGWVLAPACCLLAIYVLSFSWLWITQHDSRLGARVLPWSYVINLTRQLQIEKQNRLQFEPLPAATAQSLSGRKRVAVLVIGESARADRHSMLGYARDTNPGTRAVGAVAIPGVQACASYTLGALNCILSHRGDAAPERSAMGEPLPSYLQRQGVDVIWRTANSGQPPLQVRLLQNISELAERCSGASCETSRWDEGLLQGLPELIAQSPASRVFIVLHLSGSHGPAYHTKYPPQFERYTPTCKSVILKECDPQALGNAYDNTIVYTDHVLATLSRTLQAMDVASAWLYLSDHGESLGESGLYLHGMPRALSPREQLDIPFKLWLSPAFRQETAADPARAARLGGVGQGHVFHTVMGMLALSGGPYRRQFDLMAEIQ